MSESSSTQPNEDSNTQRRAPRLPTWLIGVLILALFGWYAWEFFGPATDHNTGYNQAVTAGEMANLCLTPSLCGVDQLTNYQYQHQSYQWGRASSVDVTFVVFIVTPVNGACPTWQLPSPIQAKFTDSSGLPSHKVGGSSQTVTACDPYFYVDPHAVVSS